MFYKNEDYVKIPKNYIFVGIIIVTVTLLGIFIGPRMTGKNVDVASAQEIRQPIQAKQVCQFECCIDEPNYENRLCQGTNYQCINNRCVKASCPYECCPDGEYAAKSCLIDYECHSSKCIPVDSDKDGLADTQERLFGSNPLAFDTDSDGLNDYAEKQKNTDPNNPNTDSDRYNDNVDSDPIIKNSAHVNVQITSKEWLWDLSGMTRILQGDTSTRVGTVEVDVSIQNTGNDYTEYTGFDIILKLANTEIKKSHELTEKLNIGETQSRHYEYVLKFSDIPNSLINAVVQQSSQWDIRIQNVNYERFG